MTPDATALTYGELMTLCEGHGTSQIYERHLAALDAVRMETWEQAIKAGEHEAYELAPTHNGNEQLAVRMILEAIRAARQQAEVGDCCSDYKPNIRIIDGAFVLAWVHGCKSGYTGKPFVYCPWCGKILEIRHKPKETP